MAKEKKVVPAIVKKLLGSKNVEVEFSEEEQKLIKMLDLSGGSCSVKDLSSMIDKSTAGVVDLAQAISDKGIRIWHEKEGGNLHLGGANVELPAEDLVVKENEIRVGVIADTLLGSKCQQLTALHNAFQIADEKKIDFMIHLGVSAGKPTAKQEEEFHQFTFEDQVKYIVANYPRSSTGFKTRFISGYHDMKWQSDKRNILAEVCNEKNGRKDLYYRGTYQSNFLLRKGTDKNAKWPILMAAYRGGDTTPYAKSYHVQGFQEGLIQNIEDLFGDDKPDIGVVAGQGVYLDLPGDSINNLFAVPAMRTVPPSVLRKKPRMTAPTVGFIILTIKFNEDGTFFVNRSCFPLDITKNDYKVKFSEDKQKVAELSKDENDILKLLEKSQKSHGELAQAIDKSADTVTSTVNSLRAKGYEIYEQVDSKSLKLLSDQKTDFRVKLINFADYFHTTVRRGGVSDTHFGSIVDLIPIQEEAYDIFEKEGVKDVEHLGDVTNGSSKHNEHKKGEVYEDRATPLIDLTVSKYPRREGITTHMVAGDHDGWFMISEGLDLIRHVADLRPDIDYLGLQKGEVNEGIVDVLLNHYNWGTGYARTLKPQQVIETIIKKVAKETKRYKGKITVVLSGGGHVFCAMLLKGVIFILMPCLQGGTNFIDGLGKISDVGFIIYSVTYSKKGKLTEFSLEYFDRVAAARALERKRAGARKRKREALKNPVKKTEKPKTLPKKAK